MNKWILPRLSTFILVFPVFFEFCPYSWQDLWAHMYLVVVHHLPYHGIHLVCIPDKYICEEAELPFRGEGGGAGGNPNPKANKQTETAQLSKIMQRIKSNLWGSVQAHAETRAGSECLCDREPEREEALKLKLLLQLCICSESLVWLTLTVFTLASAQMEQLWQQKKQVILLITCCSRQLHQDPFLRAQMKQRRLYWALLLLLVLLSQGKNACLFKYVPKGIWSLCCYPQRMLIFGAALLQSFVWAVCCAIWRIIWLMGSVCLRKQNNYFLIHWCYVRHGSHVKDRRPLLKKQCC